MNATAYYDGFANRLLTDYWQSNPRTLAAIHHAIRWIPRTSKRIIDIGCGIGWSSQEIARHFPAASILGLDLSPELISVARRLGVSRNVSYHAGAFLSDGWRDGQKYDAAVLIDVYEHFAIAEREEVNAVLSQVLSVDGVIVLTFPTPQHQSFLRREHSERLQPIDEDVRLVDLLTLAKNVQGEVAFYQEVSVWRPSDYAHAVIARRRNGTGRLRPSTRWRVRVESSEVRRSRVRSRLNLHVYPGGITAPVRTGKTLCIATPLLGATSETFISNQIKHLPFRVCLLHGKLLHLNQEGQAVASLRAMRFLDPLQRPFASVPAPACLRGQTTFLREEKAVAVLAQYGPTGVDVLAACRRAKTPLVVHFHGGDAYRKSILEMYGSKYKSMFAYAGAIIAVSHEMEDQLRRLGAPVEKLFYAPYGVDMDFFSDAKPGESVPAFLAVGRFVEKKGPLITLAAFREVLCHCPKATLRMIGEGPLLAPARQLAEALGIGHAVVFPGPQSPEGVAAAMRESRAFVQHSIHASDGDAEGTPVAILEAQASGLPVVATRHTGIRDVVREGESGFLVDEMDARAMANAMILLATDSHLAARMGREARSRMSAEYSLPLAIARLTEVIERVIQGR